MKRRKFSRMFGWRHGNIAVIRIQYRNGEEEIHILKGGKPYENDMEPMALD